jgi:hypothetical protein
MNAHNGSTSSKRAYVAPRLKTYGNVLQLTASGTSGSAEGNGSNATDPTKRP